MKIDYTDLLGKEFRYGGRGPDAFDCYGLAMEVSRRAGIELPEWESVCERVSIHNEIGKGKELFRELPGPKPFCIVSFMIRPPHTSHMGVVLGDGLRFIHILERMRVGIERLDDPAWKRRISGFWELKR